MTEDEAGRRRARGELESEVMAALWSAGEPLTPAGVQAALGSGLAYNTVQTILSRLLEKELVRRGRAGRGRGHAYWPAQDAATLAATRMRAALDGRPDRRAVLQQFAAALGEDDAETLRALLAERGMLPLLAAVGATALLLEATAKVDFVAVLRAWQIG